MSWRAGGIRPWIVQRLTAVFMALVLVVVTFKILAGGTADFVSWHTWMASSAWNTVIILFWLAVFAHAWIGIRDVIMDYISPDGLRFAVLSIFGLYLIAMTIWMMKIFFMAGSA